MQYLNFISQENFFSRSEDLDYLLVFHCSCTIQKVQHTQITLFYKYIDWIQEHAGLLQ